MRIAHLLLLAAACAPNGRAVDELTWSTDTLNATGVLHLDLSAQHDSTTAIDHPLYARAGSTIRFVTDRGTDRVAILDETGTIQRWIGSRGRGPGELFGVAHIAIRDTTVLVAEALNGRVSEFGMNGQFIHAYASPFAAGSLAATRTAVVAAARSPTHYGNQLRRRGPPVPALRRPRIATQESQRRWIDARGHDLIAGDSTAFWTLDQVTGALCRYDAPDDSGSCRLLPTALRNRLMRYREERVAALERSAGLSVQAAPLVKDMVSFDGTLALLLPLPELPIAMIAVDAGRVTPVTYAGDALPTWVRSATSFAWDGSRFIVVSDQGIGQLYLQPQATKR